MEKKKKKPDVECWTLFILWPVTFVPLICIQNLPFLLIWDPICQSLCFENPIDFKEIWPSRMIALKTNFSVSWKLDKVGCCVISSANDVILIGSDWIK